MGPDQLDETIVSAPDGVLEEEELELLEVYADLQSKKLRRKSSAVTPSSSMDYLSTSCGIPTAWSVKAVSCFQVSGNVCQVVVV